jgi:hypothetical protein
MVLSSRKIVVFLLGFATLSVLFNSSISYSIQSDSVYLSTTGTITYPIPPSDPSPPPPDGETMYRGIGKTGFQYTLQYWHVDEADFDFMTSTFPENKFYTINFDCRKVMPNCYDSSPSYEIDTNFVTFLDNYMSWCDEKGIKLLILNELPVTTPTDYWSNEIYRNGIAECFKYMAGRYPTIIGFDPINEPWQKAEAWSDSDYIAHRNFVEYIIDKFRSANPNTIAFVQGPRKHWREDAMGWVREFPVRRENVFYSFHLYSNSWNEESPWTDMDLYGYYSWVADYKSGNYAAAKEKLRNELYSRWGFIKDLDSPYGHEIFLGEFAVNPELPGAIQYLEDIISILNEWDASGSYFTWFSPEHRPMVILERDHSTLRQGLVTTLRNSGFFIQ